MKDKTLYLDIISYNTLAQFETLNLGGRYLANNLILFHILFINCQYLKGTSQGLRHHYKLILRSENKDYEPVSLSPNEMDSFHIIGKVVWVSRAVM
jgi:hypothetical protein